MPDTPIKPPNKRVDELTTQITSKISKMFPDISNIKERQTKIINDLGKELAIAMALIEEYEKLRDEK